MLHFYTPWKHQNIALKWVKNGEKKIALSKYIILMTFLLIVMFYSLNLFMLLTTKKQLKK